MFITKEYFCFLKIRSKLNWGEGTWKITLLVQTLPTAANGISHFDLGSTGASSDSPSC